MPRKKIGQEFQVQYSVKLMVSEAILAPSLEEAIAAGRTRKAHEVVDLDGLEYLDGEIEVTGVFA